MEMREHGFGKSYNFLFAVSAILFIVGFYLGIMSFVKGHVHVYNLSKEISNGMQLATYIFFVVTSTGLCLVSSLGHVFKVGNLEHISKRAVLLSIATILSGFLVLLFELEAPWRGFWMFLTPNFKSPIFWMGVLYSIYLIVMILEFGSLVFGIHFLAGIFGFLGVVFGVAAHSNMGAIFGTLQGRLIWHGPLMPVYFIASAFLSGAAALLLFTFIAYWLRGKEMEPEVLSAVKTMAKFFALFIFILIFIDVWKIIIGLYGRVTGEYESEMALIKGPLSVNYWFFEIFLGLVFPLLLLLFTWFKSRKAMFLASLSCIIGVFFMRYDLVLEGQILPLWYYVGATQANHYLSYFPSPYELLISFGGMGFCFALYLFVERFIGLDS